MSIKRLSRLWWHCILSLLTIYTAACQAALPVTAPVAATPTRSVAITSTPSAVTPAVAQLLLDRSFELAVGQEVALADTDLHLRFEHLLDDSRCPRQVACVWSGQARVSVSIWRGDATPETKEFSTFSRPPDVTDTHLFQGFSIKLLTVSPYPDTPDQAVPPAAYRVTLLVTRSP